MTGRKLLGVFAHPDDETHTVGGCMLRYTGEGATATVLTFTRGEAGQIAKGVDATPERLGEVREAELRAACAILGCDDVRVVGTPDGGTDVTDDGIARIIEVLDEVQPDVVVTMEPHGVTRHPDHIAVHDMTAQAVERVREKGYPQKFYLAAWPEAAFRAFMKMLADRDITWLSPDDPLYPVAAPDQSIAAIVDVGEWAERKLEALKAHATQGDDLLNWVPHDIMIAEARAESFQRVLPPKDRGVEPETDLFAGLV